MTAKEAKEKALWNKLPDVVKERISMCINSGSMERLSINREEALNRSNWSVDIMGILKELGYSVIISGGYYIISWKKYD